MIGEDWRKSVDGCKPYKEVSGIRELNYHGHRICVEFSGRYFESWVNCFEWELDIEKVSLIHGRGDKERVREIKLAGDSKICNELRMKILMGE